ncbi:VanZ family protein [Listeria sp. PSOL-1]|uniref:VanZ family protein n=1 Tax=Listeria sp. PSOL-1 TaxID=1844999 RepID=UPI0013D5C849|nr:VanZ family protein [Listeria sp. PSOL-1]
MSNYLLPIQTAAIIFPILAFFLTLPFAIYSYRKFGGITFIRIFVVFSFIFYLLAALFLTMLPLPDPKVIAHTKAPTPQLVPFTFIRDFINQSGFIWNESSTYLHTLTKHVFIQPLFNIFLFLPLGVYLRYYFRVSLLKTIIISFLISLFFEVTQLTGIYGLYPHAYRLFDIDDLLLNTSGSMIGFLMAPLITFFLPSREKIDLKSYIQSKQVSYIRRFFAYLIDWFIINLLTELLESFKILPFNALKLSKSNDIMQLVWLFIMVLLYFIVLPALTNGKTIGKWIVHIKIVQQNGNKATFKQLLVRYSLLYYAVFGLLYIIQIELMLNNATKQIQLILFILSFGIIALFLLHLFINIILRDRTLFYEKISHTMNQSTFK